MGNQDFYIRCLNIYFRTNDIARLEQFCAQKDWQQAFKCVHTLKGSAGNMALERLYEIYSEMTEYFRSGDAEDAVKLLPAAVELEKALREAAGYETD
ncbi:MAG: Hpt domain-containing protein [Oscillospiraceae bacterium]